MSKARLPLRLLTGAVLLIAGAAGAQTRSPLDGLDSYITSAMRDWKIPGVAVGIIHGDTVVFQKGFGVRTIGKPEKVDEHTLFGIASDSKAFTGMLIAMLVDDGKLRWDAPLTTYLPTLRFGDDYLTRDVTLRDALSHRTGLARADLLWTAGWNYDRAELLSRLRYLKPSWGLRSGYRYSNLMYMAAGEAAAQATGKSWVDLIQERIFNPLGMTESNLSVTLLPALPNVATPHGEVDRAVVPVPYTNVDNIPAAAAVNSNVVDMLKWLRFQLDSGRVNGKRLVSKRSFIETHTPQTIVRIDSTYHAFNPFTHVRSYAIGWNVMDYRGVEMMSHAGNLAGMAAMVGMLPEKRVGVVVLTNLEGNALRESIMYKVFDLYLGAPQRDWSRISLIEQASFDSIGEVNRKADEAKRVPNTSTSLALDRYAGTYRDDLYGTAIVRMENGHLVLDLAPRLIGDMEHWHYDTFKVTWRDHREGTNLVTFTLDSDGQIDTMSTDIGGPQEEIPRMRRISGSTTRTSTNKQ